MKKYYHGYANDFDKMAEIIPVNKQLELSEKSVKEWLELDILPMRFRYEALNKRLSERASINAIM